MSSASSSSLRVAIVGGGVCGMTCAIGLIKAGVDVHVYEAASKFGEIGAGVALGRNAINILTELDVYDDVHTRSLEHEAAGHENHDWAKTHPPRGLDDMHEWFKYVSGKTGETLWEVNADTLAQGVHRAAFLDALVHHVDPSRAHFHKRCTHVTQDTPDGPVTMYFQDGTTAEADVVLGADGIKSAVRRYVADTSADVHDPHLKYSRCVAYRALIPADKAEAAGCKFDYSARPLCPVGHNRHIIIFTVNAGTMINIAAFVTDPEQTGPESYVPPPVLSKQSATREQLLKAYEGWGSEMTNLLSCVEETAKWDIDVVYPPIEAEGWTKGSVAILGDAAHGMQPHLGAGAGQGLEDAYLLIQLMSHAQTNKSNVSDVLKVYAAVRQPRAQKVWDSSKRAGDIYEGRAGDDLNRFAEVEALEKYIWNRPVNADLKDAEELLVKQGVFH